MSETALQRNPSPISTGSRNAAATPRKTGRGLTVKRRYTPVFRSDTTSVNRRGLRRRRALCCEDKPCTVYKPLRISPANKLRIPLEPSRHPAERETAVLRQDVSYRPPMSRPDRQSCGTHAS